jgi:hypothetical protein
MGPYYWDRIIGILLILVIYIVYIYIYIYIYIYLYLYIYIYIYIYIVIVSRARVSSLYTPTPPLFCIFVVVGDLVRARAACQE